MRIHVDAWLSSLMDRDVLRVDVAAGDAPTEPAEQLREDFRARSQAFYFAKVDCAEVATARRLSLMGFYVVDVNVTFALVRKPQGMESRHDGLVREASAEDGPVMLELAESCFRYSRFHLDPLLPTALAHRIKREWIANYLTKQRGDKLFAAVLDGRPVGFLAALCSASPSEQIATIDLIGVDSRLQRRNIGQSLIEAFIRQYGGSDVLQVGTQVANVPSTRLYEKLGFSLTKSQYVMHMHVRDGRVER